MIETGEKTLSLIKKAELRKFGLIVGFILVILGFLPAFKDEGLNLYLIIFSSILFILALIIPNILLPFYKVWMRVGKILGKINSFLILSLIFYLIFTPLGLIRRMFKVNSTKFMHKTNEGSLWIKRVQTNPKESMERIF